MELVGKLRIWANDFAEVSTKRSRWEVVYLSTPTFVILLRTTHFRAATLPQIDSILFDVILK